MLSGVGSNNGGCFASVVDDFMIMMYERLQTAPVVVKLGSSLGVIGFGHPRE